MGGFILDLRSHTLMLFFALLYVGSSVDKPLRVTTFIDGSGSLYSGAINWIFWFFVGVLFSCILATKIGHSSIICSLDLQYLHVVE